MSEEKVKTENRVDNVPVTIFLNLENEDQTVKDFQEVDDEYITWSPDKIFSQDPEYILKSEHDIKTRILNHRIKELEREVQHYRDNQLTDINVGQSTKSKS